jgi:hypothetical protein
MNTRRGCLEGRIINAGVISKPGTTPGFSDCRGSLFKVIKRYLYVRVFSLIRMLL